MNTTSLEISKRLYELSGWEGNGGEWQTAPVVEWTPQYTLGYLLRKLPATLDMINEDNWLTLAKIMAAGGLEYMASYDTEDDMYRINISETPEDAAGLLAIKLFEENILTKETK